MRTEGTIGQMPSSSPAVVQTCSFVCSIAMRPTMTHAKKIDSVWRVTHGFMVVCPALQGYAIRAQAPANHIIERRGLRTTPTFPMYLTYHSRQWLACCLDQASTPRLWQEPPRRPLFVSASTPMLTFWQSTLSLLNCLSWRQ